MWSSAQLSGGTIEALQYNLKPYQILRVMVLVTWAPTSHPTGFLSPAWNAFTHIPPTIILTHASDSRHQLPRRNTSHQRHHSKQAHEARRVTASSRYLLLQTFVSCTSSPVHTRVVSSATGWSSHSFGTVWSTQTSCVDVLRYNGRMSSFPRGRCLAVTPHSSTH